MRGRFQALFCPSCFLDQKIKGRNDVSLSFMMTPYYVLKPKLMEHEQLDPPYFEYKCPSCRFGEIHMERPILSTA